MAIAILGSSAATSAADGSPSRIANPPKTVASGPDANWDERFGAPGLSGADNPVYAVATSGANTYVGGALTTIGGTAVHNIAMWNGRSWTTLGGGVNGTVDAITVSGQSVYVGGQFTTATQFDNSALTVNGIARWDGASWHALGAGVNGSPAVAAIAVSGANVYIGGNFAGAGSAPNSRGIARWNGSTWTSVGGGLPFGKVVSLAISGTTLYAGGNFVSIGSPTAVSANNVAMWNGTSWQPLGTGVTGGLSSTFVNSMTVVSGVLYAGGNFASAGGQAATAGIATWNGTAWQPLTGGGVSSNGIVQALAANAGYVYVAGQFASAGTVAAAHGFARYAIAAGAWSGTDPVPTSNASSNIQSLAPDPTSNGVYAAGHFATLDDATNGAHLVPVVNIARFDGSRWHALGQGITLGSTSPGTAAVATNPANGYVYAAGLQTAAGDAAGSIAWWDGVTWQRLGSVGTMSSGPGTGTVNAIAFSGTKVFVGGSFDSIDGVAAHNIAVWDGHTWAALFTGTDKPVRALLVSGGFLYAGGDFQSAGGSSGLTASLARWTLAADPATDGWQAVGDAPGGMPLPGSIYTLASTSLAYNGQAGPWLIVGGHFSHTATSSAAPCQSNSLGWDINNLVLWSPTAGYSYPPGCGIGHYSTVRALAMIGSTLYVGSDTNQFGASPSNTLLTPGIAKVAWSYPGTWSALGAGLPSGARVYALTAQGSNLYVGGFFTGTGAPGNNVARWSGGAWSALGSGVLTRSSTATVWGVTAAPSGVYVGGRLDLAGGQPSANIARWVPTPATNLLSNPGFETAADGVTPDGWTVTPPNPSVIWSSGLVHGGAHALSNASTTGTTYSVAQDVPVTAGKVYGFTGWVDVPVTRAALSLTPKIVWKDAAGTVLRTNVAHAYTKSTGGWDEFALLVAAPAGAVTGEVTLAVSNLHATVAVDDLTFGVA